jgi:MoxR-like ATPase
MTKWHKDSIHERAKAKLEIDKEAAEKSIEVTETFIKALDPVGMESDKVSKITYTTDIARTSHMCLSCDEHIDVKHLYVRKENYGSIAHSYCVECACIDIKKDDATDKTTDLCIYVTEEVAMDRKYDYDLTPTAEHKVTLKYKEVKEMTDKEVEDYDEREGLEALFGDRPTHDEEDTPDEELEVEEPPAPHIPTIMSKLKGSVDMPEEFKFADSTVFYTMLRNIFRGKSILVLGPSGCGKSSLGKILADITHKPYYAFNFGDTMNPAAKILGDTKYDSVKGTFFKKSRFVSALQDREGSFIMLDEVTRDRTGDLANILMPVLDGQKYLALDESDDADTVDINANAFFYATANIGREYLGAAHDLDRAWKDRFTGGIYELEYLPKKKEQELLMIRSPSLDEKDADRITEFALRVRDLYKAEEISTAVSTRMCLSTAEFVVDGMSLIDALKQVCLPFYPVVAGDDSERVQVIQTIQSMGD